MSSADISRRQLLMAGLVLPSMALGDEPSIPAPTVISEDQPFTIKSQGAYRLSVDVRYGSAGWDPTAERRPGGVLGSIYSGRVDLDLGGHTLGTGYGKAGLVVSAGNIRKPPKWRGERPYTEPREILVRNGRLDIRGDKVGPAVQFYDLWSASGALQVAARGAPHYQGHRAPPPADMTYVDSAFLIEDLNIQADHVGLFVEGARTVIRRCVIESASLAAIFVAGPRVTIEDCEIRLRSLKLTDYGEGETPLRAAIVLRDGSNAVIRNNRIRIDPGGLPADTRCIAVRDGASDVLVQGNTFINVHGEPVSFMDGSSGTVVDNRRESKGWPL